MKKIFITVIIFTIFVNHFALAGDKSKKTPFLTYAVDVTTQHLWRGFKSGDTPSIEPSLKLHFTPNLTFGLWGASTFNDSYKEVDLYLGYQYKQFSVTLFDYYDPAVNTFKWKDVSDFNQKTTEHIVDLVMDYQFKKIPVKLLASTIIYGNDRDEEGQQNYSSYVELAYTIPYKPVASHLFIGVNPTGTFYHDKFNVVNLGIKAEKTLKITNKYSIPIQANLSGNPAKEQLYFGVVLTIL